jgi:hypothetical protein
VAIGRGVSAHPVRRVVPHRGQERRGVDKMESVLIRGGAQEEVGTLDQGRRAPV